MEIYKIATKCLDHIDYESIERPKESTYVPYSKGAGVSMILVHYLREIDAYKSYGSGEFDFGIITKPIYGIPTDRFVMIEPISETQFKITYIVENVGILECALMAQTDYDMRVLEKLGYTKKFVIVDFKISHSEHFDC